MNGFYVILLVTIISIFYLQKHFKRKRKISEVDVLAGWKQFGNYFKYGSIVLCIIATLILWGKIVSFSNKAQEDFEIFLTLLFYVLPAIFLVFLSIIFHIKYDLYHYNGSVDYWFTPFLRYAIITIILPLLIFLYFEFVLN